jgi:two-component system sensor histidine kinase MprB
VTLRLRMAAIAAGAVTVVVAVIAVVVYLAVRSDLRGEVDHVLEQQAAPLAVTTVTSSAFAPNAGGLAAGLVTGVGAGVAAPKIAGKLPGAPLAVGVAITDGPPQPFTGAGGYIQFLQGDGGVVKSVNEGSLPHIPPTGTARAIAARGSGRELIDTYVDGEHMRLLTLGVGPGGAVQLAQPLAAVDRELSNLVVILLLVGCGGILAAAVLGAVVARAALAPIARFTRRTEGLAAAAEGTQRLEVVGRDELARLARSFNRTLDDLERSVAAQRQLVADASHELRTPITSLRANIQVLEQADRLGAGERRALREDVIAELDELTGLVSDLVELARGTDPAGAGPADDVRLDELVQAAVARAARRAGSISMRVDVEPTLVNGDARRIDRALANMLDNAVKWSPPGAAIETTLRGGAVTVRDHGPGFAERDLADVFARFYRADDARGKPGSGLGLAIVKQAAEAHGGHGGACVTASFGLPTRLLQPADTGLTIA